MSESRLRIALIVFVAGTGVFVVLSELPYWGARASLAPVLTALGLGLIAAAAAQALPRE